MQSIENKPLSSPKSRVEIMSEMIEEIKYGLPQFYGYKEETKMPLINSDETTLFTSATISGRTNKEAPGFRKYLVDLIPPEVEGYYLFQKCLRTNNLPTLTNDHPMPFCGQFTAFGIIAPPNKLKPVCENMLELLQIIDLSSNKLCVFIDTRDEDLINIFARINIKKELITNKLENESLYSTWTYGMQDIRGRGVTLALAEEGLGSEFANIIIIEKYDKTTNTFIPIAVEAGGGLETMISKAQRLKHPVLMHKMADVMTLTNDTPEYLLKTAEACIVIATLFQEGIKPGSGKARSVLKKYIQALTKLSIKHDFETDQLLKWINGYSEIEYNKELDLDQEDKLITVMNKSKLIQKQIKMKRQT